MKFYILYTPEGYTYSPNNDFCENYQILGFSQGITQKQAFNNFLLNNSWIKEYNFSVEKIIIRQVL